MDKRIERAVQWYDKRTHRERLWTLILGMILMTLIWYLLFFYPLMKKNILLKHEARDLQTQLSTYQQKADLIAIFGPKNIMNRKQVQQQNVTQQQKLNSMKFETASIEHNDQLVHTIFSPEAAGVKITSLKSENGTAVTDLSKVEVGENLEIAFQSNYFDTLSYLETLEKLPWCLSWDTLEYKVTNYPDAEVVLKLHIVNT